MYALSGKECLHCGEYKDIDSFHRNKGAKDGRRPECKDCARKIQQERRKENPYIACLNSMADNLIKRLYTQIDRPVNKTYKERGIKSLIGKNRGEIRETLHKHYGDDIKRLLRKGEKPTLDRIDPYGHYELGNIQIITFDENRRRADTSSFSRKVIVTHPDGREEVFASVLEASKRLGCKRDTIYSGAENPGTNRKGLTFKILDKGES